MDTKQCPKCKMHRFVSEFYKDKERKDGLGGWCKRCRTKVSTAWNKAHPERVRENHQRWVEKHPELTKLMGTADR